MIAFIVLVISVIHVFGVGVKIIDKNNLASARLSYTNFSAVLNLDIVNDTLVCPGEDGVVVKQSTNGTCPKYLVGVNDEDPKCALSVKGDSCFNGNVEVSGTLKTDQCNVGYRVCQTPMDTLVSLQSMISPAVDQMDYDLTSEDLRSGAKFGSSVSSNSTFILSGAPFAVSRLWPSLVTGAAYIFQSYISFVNTTFSRVEWVQTQALSPFSSSTSGEVDDCQFGASAKLLCGADNSLQFVALGAPSSDIVGTNRGCVYIFQNIGSVINIDGNTFPLVDPIQRVVSPDPRNNAFFGQTVEFALFRDGTRQMFVGAPKDRDLNVQNDAGTVYWYQWSTLSSTWEYKGELSCTFAGVSSTLKDSLCGSSIAFAQDPSGLAVLTIGAPAYKRLAGLAGAGSISIFQWDTLLLDWVSVGGKIPNTGDIFYGLNYKFGYAISFSGNAQWLFVGVPGATINSTLSTGMSIVYQQSAINSTSYSVYRQPMTIPEPAEIGGTPDEFGFALVSNWDSNKVVICAPGFGLITSPNSGLCFLFHYSALTGSWNETYTIIKGEQAQSGSLFGYSVDMDLIHIVTGSPGYQIGPISNGIASINYDLTSLTYERNTTCIQERGVLLSGLTMSCQFVLLSNIPPGFYRVTTNTSSLGIPSTLIIGTFYQFTDWGTNYLDSYFSMKYYSPTITQEDEFVFYFVSRTHTSANINLLAKIILGVPTP